MIRIISVVILLLCLGSSAFGQSSVVLQSASTNNGNGSTLNVISSASVVAIVNCTSCSGGTTINFEATQDGITFVPISGLLSGSSLYAVTTTASGATAWVFGVSGFRSFRARISNYSSGTVTVTGTASPMAAWMMMPPGTPVLAQNTSNIPPSLPAFGLGVKNALTELSWMTGTGVPWDYRYTYVNTGWKAFNSPNGQIASMYVADSFNNDFTPVFTWNEGQTAGWTTVAQLVSNFLQNTSYMAGYYQDFTLLLQKTAGWFNFNRGSTHLADLSLSNDNTILTHTGATAEDATMITGLFHSAGQYLFQVTINACSATAHCEIGIGDPGVILGGGYIGRNSFSAAITAGGLFINNVVVDTTCAAPMAAGEVDEIAVDLTAQLIWVRTNGGNWNGNTTANPSTGRGGCSLAPMSGISSGVAPAADVYTQNDQMTLDVTTPIAISGFTAWNNSAPLPVVVIQMEPDQTGLLQQNGYTAATTISVASSGNTDCAAYPNSYSGYYECLLHLRDLYAPGMALMAVHISTFGANNGWKPTFSGSSPTAQGTADINAAFINSLKINFDLSFVDCTDCDADSAWIVSQRSETISQAWWTPTIFNAFQSYLAELSLDTKLALIWWQIPVGNTLYLAQNNTSYHFQDNKVETLLQSPYTTLAAYQTAGVIGFLFGGGQDGANPSTTDMQNYSGQSPFNPAAITDNNTGSTTSLVSTLADDDGGELQLLAGSFYQSHH